MTQKKFLLLKTQEFQALLEDTADFYLKQSGIELSIKFIKTVQEAVAKIAINPEIYPDYQPEAGYEYLLELNYKQFFLNSFSPFFYTLYYEIEGQTIIIRSLYSQTRHREKLLTQELELVR